MTGPEHYTAGELDLLRATEAELGAESSFYLGSAQAHFTAALVAATAEPRHGRGIGRLDHQDDAWQAVLR